MGALLNFPRFRAFTAAGVPLAGGKVHTYVAGTSTALATYSDGDLTTENTNPVVLDANGEADIFGVTNQDYKIILKNASDVTQWTLDYISLNSNASDSALFATNFLDNAGLELHADTIARPAATAATGSSTCIGDRWWGYRGGVTDYVIGVDTSTGMPNCIKMSRNVGTSNTTSLVCGQHLGGITSTGAWTNSTVIQKALANLSQNLVLSFYFKTGANFSGSGVTIEIVSNSTTQNVLSGTGWTVEASASLVAAQLSSSAWTRLSVAKTGALSGSNHIVGVRARFNSPSGTAGAADLVYVTGGKLELNNSSSPTQYVIPSMEESRIRCGVWYRVWGHRSGGGGEKIDFSSYGAGGQNYDLPIRIWPPMMVGVAATVGGTFTVSNCGQPTVVSGTNSLGFILRTAVTGLGAFSITSNANGSVTMDAEIA